MEYLGLFYLLPMHEPLVKPATLYLWLMGLAWRFCVSLAEVQTTTGVESIQGLLQGLFSYTYLREGMGAEVRS